MSSSASCTIQVDLAKYKYVDVDLDSALKLLSALADEIGKETNDMREVKRYINNFDEFHDYMRKKFKDFIAPPHRPDDYIKNEAVIDKVKLYVSESGEKRIVIVFDRRISVDVLKKCLERIGCSEVNVEKLF